MSEFCGFTTEEVVAVLALVSEEVEWMRKNGEGDLRSLLTTLRSMRDAVNHGAGLTTLRETFGCNREEG